MKGKNHVAHSSQRGVALVVSLILLVVITLLSVTAMRSANLDTRISVNHQHKQLSFQAAENALSQLTAIRPEQMKALEIPGTLDETTTNCRFVEFQPEDGDARRRADLNLKLVEISKPGQYKFSGYGLNITTIIYQADAYGHVENTGAMTHNRMRVALVR